MQEKGQGPSVSLEEPQDGFIIQLPAALLFKAGSATIENEDALLFLKRIALIIDTLPANVEVSVRGHTDDGNPGKNSPFKDNWELSTARAISVLQELIVDGVKAERMHAAGFAQYRPLGTNATKKGRENNRRVEIHFQGAKSEQEAKVSQSVLQSQ